MFYSRMLIYSDIAPSEETFDTMLQVLSESVWDGTTAQAREQAFPLFDCLGIARPEVKAGKKKIKEVKESDDDYASLVKEMGY
jgi:hypothetical protein